MGQSLQGTGHGRPAPRGLKSANAPKGATGIGQALMLAGLVKGSSGFSSVLGRFEQVSCRYGVFVRRTKIVQYSNIRRMSGVSCRCCVPSGAIAFQKRAIAGKYPEVESHVALSQPKGLKFVPFARSRVRKPVCGVEVRFFGFAQNDSRLRSE